MLSESAVKASNLMEIRRLQLCRLQHALTVARDSAQQVTQFPIAEEERNVADSCVDLMLEISNLRSSVIAQLVVSSARDASTCSSAVQASLHMTVTDAASVASNVQDDQDVAAETVRRRGTRVRVGRFSLDAQLDARAPAQRRSSKKRGTKRTQRCFDADDADDVAAAHDSCNSSVAGSANESTAPVVPDGDASSKEDEDIVEQNQELQRRIESAKNSAVSNIARLRNVSAITSLSLPANLSPPDPRLLVSDIVGERIAHTRKVCGSVSLIQSFRATVLRGQS